MSEDANVNAKNSKITPSKINPDIVAITFSVEPGPLGLPVHAVPVSGRLATGAIVLFVIAVSPRSSEGGEACQSSRLAAQ